MRLFGGYLLLHGTGMRDRAGRPTRPENEMNEPRPGMPGRQAISTAPFSMSQVTASWTASIDV